MKQVSRRSRKKVTSAQQESSKLPPDVPPQPPAGRWRFGRREPLWIGLLCLLGAARMFVYAAAFPLFNNIDEEVHFDLVCRYSHGDIPRELAGCSEEASRLIAMYRTQEYLATPEVLREMAALKRPVWSMPAEEQALFFPLLTKLWRDKIDHEATQPPLYYAVAGGWYDLGQWVGIRGGNLPYWARFFNVPIYGLLIWLAYIFVKQLFPANTFLHLGVPLLLVFFPQDIFYSINNDVLSAPLVTLTMYLALRMYRSAGPSPGLALAAGLSAAAALLTKYTNAPVLVLVGILAVFTFRKFSRTPRSAAGLAAAVLLLLTFCLPVGCWLARNYFVLGDLVGTAAEHRYLGWKPKPMAQFWNHPVFTPTGLARYGATLIPTFWQGEFWWHGAGSQPGGATPFTSRQQRCFSWHSSSVISSAVRRAKAATAGRPRLACSCRHLRGDVDSSLPVVRFWGMYLSFAGLAFLLIGTADPRGAGALHDHVSRRNGRNPSLAAAEFGARAGDGRHHGLYGHVATRSFDGRVRQPIQLVPPAVAFMAEPSLDGDWSIFRREIAFGA